ncbi:helix-turn-helix domain-containing protein [Bradyrhizobium sp.]|uniref:AraC family transcriptional regulator n=1 Tax=Bradyrhizobium sp. TaxID=376 RepID=UPI003C3DB108
MVLLLRVAVLARNAGSSEVSRYSALLLASIAAYIVESAPGFGALDLRLRAPVHLMSCGTPAAFWIAMGAIFVDEFRLRWYQTLAWLALVTLGGAAMAKHPMSIDVARSVLSVSLMLLGIWQALAGRAADLVEGRRRLRVWYAVVTAFYGVVIIASEWLWPGGLSAAPLSLANATGLMGFIFLFAVLGSLPSGEPLVPVPVQGRQKPSLPNDAPQVPAPTGADAKQLAALRNLLDHGKIYREPELSVASLSRKLDVPEHRLRHLINRQLGQRNFSAFINGYRLAEAEAALGDPAQAAVPVLTIALDAGFGSIGPFNRAFKAHTGLTPTEYRRAQLGGAPGADP